MIKDNLYNYTKYILDKFKLNLKKGYGQNFLINEEIVTEIVDRADISPNDLIIEIGPRNWYNDK